MAQPAWHRRVAVLASGRGSNLAALLEARALGRIPRARFICVVSNRKGAGALDVARRFGVEPLLIDHADYPGDREGHERAIATALVERKVEFVVLAGYMRILVGPLLDMFPGRIINIHPSLLPAFPGGHAHRDAIAWGAKVSGCTVHFVSREVDAGPVILQRAVPVLEDDTEDSLAARVLAEEHAALPEAVALLTGDRLRVDGRRVTIVEAPPDPRPQLLVATTNEHKVHEIEALLGELPLRIRTLRDFPGHTDVDESAPTYRENALLKARTWHRRTGLWTLADDSGLEVEPLGGRPGVHSARYAPNAGARISKLLAELDSFIGPDRRRARFVCAAALVGPGGEEHVSMGTCEGHIARESRGAGGFGYDPVFVPDGFGGRHLAELGDAVKNDISHRSRALAGLRAVLARIGGAAEGDR